MDLDLTPLFYLGSLAATGVAVIGVVGALSGAFVAAHSAQRFCARDPEARVVAILAGALGGGVFGLLFGMLFGTVALCWCDWHPAAWLATSCGAVVAVAALAHLLLSRLAAR